MTQPHADDAGGRRHQMFPVLAAAQARDRHARVFAIGDVRAGSTKRVAAAVGDGAAAIAQIHAYLSSLNKESA